MPIEHSLEVRDRAIVIDVIEAIERSWIEWVRGMKRLHADDRRRLRDGISAKNPDDQESERQRVRQEELPRVGSPPILDGEEHLWSQSNRFPRNQNYHSVPAAEIPDDTPIIVDK
jgi:hypothetical protein